MRFIREMIGHYLKSRDSVEKIRGLIACDRTDVQQGFSTMYNRYSDIEVIGEASDGAAAPDMAREYATDAILMDIHIRLNKFSSYRVFWFFANAYRVSATL